MCNLYYTIFIFKKSGACSCTSNMKLIGALLTKFQCAQVATFLFYEMTIISAVSVYVRHCSAFYPILFINKTLGLLPVANTAILL